MPDLKLMKRTKVCLQSNFPKKMQLFEKQYYLLRNLGIDNFCVLLFGLKIINKELEFL